MIDGQEKGVRLSPPPMCPPGKTLSVLYCGKTTQPLAQPATGRTSGSGIRLYLFLTPAFDPRDVVFLFPAKTCFGGFVTPDVVGAALLTPIPPRPPSPALSCFHSKPQHPARHGLVRAFPKQAGPQGESNLSAFARWRRSISVLSPLRGATQNGRHEASSPRRKPGAIPLRWYGALVFRSAALSSIVYTIVYSLNSPTGDPAIVYSLYYDLK